ncbi:cellulose synthase subunit [Noviherbaspirillum humi]|uniref:Cyclic di-GMP-binding protein n=2 Tax=Noviherbaspirillum humi TaxID=1688639 RepID=A0A239HMV3_9BURK|nr:cellulose biosynthesis cyclic di-GMP-binding regulatory protein BcsB [Noviherbaspirillum humi]SNS82173.1 cellulose synthase subunit [Noviherbaspirillum humi]
MQRAYAFPGLERESALRLVTAEGSPALKFSMRADEVPRKMTLRLRLQFSPALIPGQSHIRILLNDETVASVPVTAQNVGRQFTQDVELDPTLLKDFNRLALDFIGHYTAECEDPLHSSLWADLHRGSELRLVLNRITTANDLATLPRPFFSLRESERLTLPFVFAPQPDLASLRAAGITASWFGKLAAWRGARFPVRFGDLPKGHAVVFATNSSRPGFLGGEAAFDGPALSIRSNPADGISKLLLISGRDGNDLAVAAEALTLGTAVLSGEHVRVTPGHRRAPREIYDAPNWVRQDRPMKFGELIDSPQQLQARGHMPEPVSISFRVPPDLFTWRSRGVPMNLKVRYTPPAPRTDAMLDMRINGEQFQSVLLRATGQGGESARVVLPMLDAALFGENTEVMIPAFKLGTRNQLDYGFAFRYYKPGPCRDVQIDNARAMIDPDSTVDFSGFRHFAELPHLGFFATAGYPFSRYADLSNTAIVLPDQIRTEDVEVMLFLLGRMGDSTGYPATHVTVVKAGDEKELLDRDLLIIGPSDHPLLRKWQKYLPAVLSGPGQRVAKPSSGYTVLDRANAWLGNDAIAPAAAAAQKHLRGNGPLAALMQFESPLARGHSVVAVTAVEQGDLAGIVDSLANDGIADTLHGSVALFHGGQTESLVAGPTYTVGSLPIWDFIWFHFADHPVLLALMSVLAVLVFAFALWRSLRLLADKRLRGE